VAKLSPALSTEKLDGYTAVHYQVQRHGSIATNVWLVQNRRLRRAERNNYTLFVPTQGFKMAFEKDGPIRRLLAQGRHVVVVDVSGIGTTASSDGTWYNQRFGSEGKHATILYLLGESLLATRTNDILSAADFVDTLVRVDERAEIDLFAEGEMGPPTLHAAALEPERFRKVHIERSLHSFTSVVETPVVENQWVHMIHGALRVYDLPDLAASLGDKLELVKPVDASGKVIEPEFSTTPDWLRRADKCATLSAQPGAPYDRPSRRQSVFCCRRSPLCRGSRTRGK
jgi:hypothetical protein